MRIIGKWWESECGYAYVALVVSAAALAASFFRPGILPVDPAWLAILLCGLPILKEAAVGLVTAFDIKADLLVSLALLASVWIGEYFAAGEVAFIMTIGALLEERTVARARAGIERLARIMPQTARVVDEGGERTVSADEVQAGWTLRVRAGETVPADGVIVRGETAVDQSVLTGESLPVEKGVGDEVSSGTVNQFGVFEMTATKVGESTCLRRMIRLVNEADAGKAKIVGLADRWATWIVVFALAAAGGTWFVTGEAIRAVTILVVFCPCALVLATPTAIMAGIGNAARGGILIRQGDALERLSAVDMVAFDKTGTLTHGSPAVIAVRSLDPAFDETRLLELAASAEAHSEHPLGRAVCAHYRHGRGAAPAEPASFEVLPGRGVRAQTQGVTILAGNDRLLHEVLAANAQPAGHAQPAGMPADDGRVWREQGATLIWVLVGGQPAGYLALADTVRATSRRAVGELAAEGYRTMLLSGDHAGAAGHIAQACGISRVLPECLPEDKVQVIRQQQQLGSHVCMIGDGINDAAALRSAHAGIAMGGIGSDIAIESADAVLVRDDLAQVPHLFALARKTMHTIRWNLALSLLLNFAAIGLAMTGILTPILGALVHNAGSVAVVLNSALLLKWHRRGDVCPAQAPALQRQYAS